MNGAGSAVTIFNQMQGRLRLSVTHQCQLRCHFCHREGIADHWADQHMNQNFFSSLVRAYAGIGGRYLEITGGEPTLHPEINELLQVGRTAGCDVILCTNGLRLDRVRQPAEAGCLQLIRLSLHHGGSFPARAQNLLGSAWDFKRIRDNITDFLALRVPMQLIFTHTGDNQDQLDDVLRRALEWRVDVQIVDLIASRVGDPSVKLGYISGTEAEAVASRYARLERIVTDRTGAVLRLYRTPEGASWEIKDYHFGVLHSAMCDGCPLIHRCGEGVYALRVDSLGIVKPCLLREDLERRCLANAPIDTVLQKNLERMLSEPLEWSYGDVIAAQKIR